MGDAAQGELPDHEVFRSPLMVRPQYESWRTPDNYYRYAGDKRLPDTTRVWRIQTISEKPGQGTYGVVAHHYGIVDSPDAEILVPGFNDGKESGAAGVSRQGNFLQWGFSAGPSKMTEAGKAFFVNCICYVRKFEGKAPLVRRQTLGREYDLFLAGMIGSIQDERFLKSIATPELLAKYQSDPQGLVSYYRQNIELIYSQGGVRIDEDLRSLGLASNRHPATLEKLVGLLRDPQKAELAKKLLLRYTTEKFAQPEQWEAWLQRNRERIYFTDSGGYKFLVVPEGYLAAPEKKAATRLAQ
jgi:hypothetical protein